MTDAAPAAAIEPNPVADSFLACLARSAHIPSPYDYWLLEGALPEEDVSAIAALPFAAPADIVFNGKRETNNATRVYFTPENQARFPVCQALGGGVSRPPRAPRHRANHRSRFVRCPFADRILPGYRGLLA